MERRPPSELIGDGRSGKLDVAGRIQVVDYDPEWPRLFRREADRYLLFRERLRGHPEERARYQRVKRELAERDWTYVQEYADAKTEVVEGIIARARGGPRA